MFKKRDEQHLFVRRVTLFISLNLVLFISIFARLYYLQVYKRDLYTLLSDKNRIVIKRILPIRGKILDRNNNVIVSNEHTYNIIYDLLNTSNNSVNNTSINNTSINNTSINNTDVNNKGINDTVNSSVNKLLDNVELDPDVINELTDYPICLNQHNRYVVIDTSDNWQKLIKYHILANTIDEISIEKSYVRNYLFPFSCSHFSGYTSAPTTDDIVKNDVLSIPLAKVGKNGIECYYEHLLFGKIGIRTLEVNSKRQAVKTIDEINSTIGKDIRLTIDIKLQNAIYELLSEHRSASCVVMNVQTGAILALVSYPGYNVNLFSKKVTRKLLKEIYNDPDKPLINKAISGLYAPGSTFKIITGLAALHYKVIDKNTRFNCSGYVELGNHKFYCWKWKYGGHGSLNLEEALEQSCDCFFYNIAKRINPDYIAQVANDFGLGFKTGVDLPNEKSGLIPNKAWKISKKKQKWTTGDSCNMVIGQGYVLTTPLQLAYMTAIFANGLKKITPHIYENAEIQPFKQLKYSKNDLKIILDGMYDVVNSNRGTARRSATDEYAYDFSGKTGSSQVCRISTKQRSAGKTTSDIYKEKEHALFIAFTPADNPKYAISVVVEHGGGGAAVAAPIVKNIVTELTKLNLTN